MADLVLVVEDNPVNALLVETILSRVGGFDVVSTVDGGEVLRLVCEGVLDAVVMDVSLAGTTLDGRSISTRDWIGKRYMLFLFNPEVDVATPAAQALAAISALRERNNFDILGIATGASRSDIESFVGKHHLDFPIIDDSSARIASALRAPVPVLLALVDDEGYVIYTTGWPEKSAIGVDAVDLVVRR